MLQISSKKGIHTQIMPNFRFPGGSNSILAQLFNVTQKRHYYLEFFSSDDIFGLNTILLETLKLLRIQTQELSQ